VLHNWITIVMDLWHLSIIYTKYKKKKNSMLSKIGFRLQKLLLFQDDMLTLKFRISFLPELDSYR
jgi:hypothetical protein